MNDLVLSLLLKGHLISHQLVLPCLRQAENGHVTHYHKLLLSGPSLQVSLSVIDMLGKGCKQERAVQSLPMDR